MFKQHDKSMNKTNEDNTLPVLSTEPNMRDTGLSHRSKNSPISTRHKYETSRVSFRQMFFMKDEERIYKLSEIDRIKTQQKSPDSSIVEMKRLWDAYPSKANLLQDTRKQFNTYLTQTDFKLPSINKSQSQDKLLSEANKIFKERVRNNKISTTSLKIRSKHDLLEENKDISHKNYIIKILQDERANINDREKLITNSLQGCERKLNMDELEFGKVKEEDQKAHKQHELNIIEVLCDIKNSNLRVKELIEIDKNLCNELHQTIKRILSLQKYASFIYDVVGIKAIVDFKKSYQQISDTANKKNEILNVTTELIKELGSGKYFDEKQDFNLNLFQDTSLLRNKFHILEEDIIKLLEKISSMEKDFKISKDHHNAEVQELEGREQELRHERKNLLKIEFKDDKIIRKLNKKSTNEDENQNVLNFIHSIKSKAEMNFFDQKLLSERKKTEDEMNLVKNTIDMIRYMETKVNQSLATLNELNKENSTLLKQKVLERKNVNKMVKQELQKKKDEELNIEKKRRTVERMNKIVIKGRVVQIRKFLNNDVKISKKSLEETRGEANAILYDLKSEDGD